MPVLTRTTFAHSRQIYTGTLQPEKTRDSEGFIPLPGRKTEYTRWSNPRVSPHSDVEQSMTPGTGWGVNRGLTAAVRSKHARTLKDVQVHRNCDVLCEKLCPTLRSSLTGVFFVQEIARVESERRLNASRMADASSHLGIYMPLETHAQTWTRPLAKIFVARKRPLLQGVRQSKERSEILRG